LKVTSVGRDTVLSLSLEYTPFLWLLCMWWLVYELGLGGVCITLVSHGRCIVLVIALYNLLIDFLDIMSGWCINKVS
jgi:hypothetical protein